MKKDIPKILKKVMEAFEETDSESDDEVETPTAVKSEETVEEQGDNTVGMYVIDSIACTIHTACNCQAFTNVLPTHLITLQYSAAKH